LKIGPLVGIVTEQRVTHTHTHTHTHTERERAKEREVELWAVTKSGASESV